MGMRLSQLKGWASLKLAILPAGLKVLVLPAVVGGLRSRLTYRQKLAWPSF